MDTLEFILKLAISLAFGWLIGRMRGVDIRQLGSKNIGATNCWRVCGWPYGVAAFVLDVAKGFLPVWTAATWLPALTLAAPEAPGAATYWLAVTLVAASPILGHLLPVWLKFKGGKAVATSLGVLLGVPILGWLALAAFAVWVVTAGVTRYVSVASSAAALAFGAGYLYVHREQAWGDYVAVTVFVLLLVAVVLMRHKSNYVRLWNGTENRLWGRNRAKP
jgi:glycerol-3-phosphate acyltransferase PlsY